METYFLLLILFFTTIICGLLGFGDALLFIPLATLLVGLQNAVIFMTIWTSVPLTLNTIKYWNHLDWQFIKRGIITGIPGTVVGLLLVAYTPIQWVKLFLGIFLLIFASSRIYPVLYSKLKGKELHLNRKPLGKGILYVGGFAFGLFGALIGASGPINAVLLERTDHHKENFIGNFAIVSIMLCITRIITYFAQSIVPLENLWVIILGFPIAIISTRLGQHFATKINEKTFRIITLILIGIIGVNSIVSAMI